MRCWRQRVVADSSLSLSRRWGRELPVCRQDVREYSVEGGECGLLCPSWRSMMTTRDLRFLHHLHWTHTITPLPQPQVQRTSGVSLAVLGLCRGACSCLSQAGPPPSASAVVHHHRGSRSSLIPSASYLPVLQTTLPHRHPSTTTSMAGGPVTFIKKRIYWYRLWTGMFLSCMCRVGWTAHSPFHH